MSRGLPISSSDSWLLGRSLLVPGILQQATSVGRNTGGCTGSSAVVCRSVDRMNASCWSFPLARLALVFAVKSKVSNKVSACIRMMLTESMVLQVKGREI